MLLLICPCILPRLFLINREAYCAIYSPDHLCISNEVDGSFANTHYYFHLGLIETPTGSYEAEDFDLNPGSSVKVVAKEAFVTSDRVIGFIGPCTALINRGLNLICSPILDPCYRNGIMTFRLQNTTDVKIKLAVGEVIGRITFFDVSDSQMGIVEHFETKYEQERTRAREELRATLSVHFNELGRAAFGNNAS